MDPITALSLAITGGETVYKLAQALRGKGPGPFGSEGRMERYREEGPEELEFKKKLYPRVQKLLEQQVSDLEKPYVSPMERAQQSPLFALLGALGPQTYQDLSGDPEAQDNEWLAPLLGALGSYGISQWGQGQQKPAQLQQQSETIQPSQYKPSQTEMILNMLNAQRQQRQEAERGGPPAGQYRDPQIPEYDDRDYGYSRDFDFNFDLT